MSQPDFEVPPGISPGELRILDALFEEVDHFRWRADDAPDHSREMQEYQVALQMWEAAYVAAGGKIDD